MSSKRVLVMGILVCAALAVASAETGTEPAGDYLWADRASADGSDLVAANPAQGLEARLGPDGLRVTPVDGDWELSLVLARSGREGALSEALPATPRADGARAELDRGDLVEWWVNEERGLEHGFTVRERPEGEGPLVLELELKGDLVALPEPGERSVALIRPGSPLAVLHYGALEVIDADGDIVPARLGPAPGAGGRLRIVVEDQGAAYPLTIDPLLTTAAWSSAESESTISVAWGDWDSDGDLDLAVGNGEHQPNRLYENTGGSLTSVWISADSDSTLSVAWGDWDGDGDLDLAAGNAYQPNRVYESTGGSLASAWTSADSDCSYSVAWGDWDGDGDLDLAAGNWDEPNRVYENQGGALTSAWTSADSDDTWSVAWGDWNSDGNLDLAAGNYDQSNRVYESTGGSLTSVWTSGDTDGTRSVAWGDWDSDGDLDLAAGNDGQPNRVYEKTGGSLTSVWTSGDSLYTRSVAWGDWDGDGDLDLAAGNVWQPNRVYENTGGALASAWTSADSDITQSVAWGDWDGDGDLDLVAGNYDEANRVYGNTGVALASAWTSADSANTYSVAWGDWDGDGDLDLAAGNAYRRNRVYENTGGSLTLVWTSADSDNTYSVAWGDWDGDGDLDLAAGSWGDPNRVYESAGGSLTLVWTSADSDSTLTVAWGDWDSDGDLDLAAANYDSQPNRVYENTGGALASAWTSADSDNTYSVAWGDWDSDGDLDLAAGNWGGPNRVYESTGGSLTSAWTSADSDDTSSVAWADWDGDGDLDLAAGNYHGQPNRVYENTGGALASVWTSGDSDYTLSVAWGDWDGDGDLDLAAGNNDQPNRVYENAGGSLASVWTSADIKWTYSVAWGDWDGDGDLDLAAGNRYVANRVYGNGFLNRPGRLPETPVTPVLADRPGETAAAFGYSTAEYLGSPVMIPFTLFDEQGDGAPRIVAEYSLNGGGQWLPASGYIIGASYPLEASAAGVDHEFLWYFANDGVIRAENVVFRVGVTWQAPDHVSAGLQRGSMASTSPPFRIWDRKADLVVTVSDGQESAVPGEALSYTITLSNLGPNDVNAARLIDTFPPALLGVTWTCDDSGGGSCANASGSGDIDEFVGLPVGTSVVFTADATIDPAPTGLLENTASATLPTGITELDPADNSATDVDALAPSTDLSVTMDDGQTEAVPGEAVTYTIVVSNAGPSAAVAAQVVDLFPSEVASVDWTCDPGGGGTCNDAGASGDIQTTVDLPVGTSVTFTATATVDSAATGVLVNTATVLPAAKSGLEGRGDPSPCDNTATDVDVLTPEVDLGITKSNGAGFAVLGFPITYTIVVTNPGPSDAAGAAVTDTFLDDLTGVEWDCTGSDGGSCTNPSGSNDINETVDLPSGGSVTFVATATVDPGATGTLENTATVACPSGVTERNATDNTSTDTDELYVLIFADGFESGDLTGW